MALYMCAYRDGQESRYYIDEILLPKYETLNLSLLDTIIILINLVRWYLSIISKA